MIGKNLRTHMLLKAAFAVTAVVLLVACASEEQPTLPVDDDVTIEANRTSATAVADVSATLITTPAPTATTLPPEPTVPSIQLPDLGPAPEINNEIWLNTDAPVTLASVQGEKAVLLEFWTFG